MEHASGCYLCWQILDKNTDAHTFECTKQNIKTCKKYMRKKIQFSGTISRNVTICSNCHQKSNFLLNVHEKIEELTKELEEIVNSFTEEILVFRRTCELGSDGKNDINIVADIETCENNLAEVKEEISYDNNGFDGSDNDPSWNCDENESDSETSEHDPLQSSKESPVVKIESSGFDDSFQMTLRKDVRIQLDHINLDDHRERKPTVHSGNILSKACKTSLEYDSSSVSDEEQVNGAKKILRKRCRRKNIIQQAIEDPDFTPPTDAEKEKVEKVPREIKCSYCLKLTFGSKKELGEHRSKVHMGPKPFECLHCPKTFRKSQKRYEHMRSMHSDDRPFVCDECGRTFKLRKNLNEHKSRHKGLKPCQCEECGKFFRSRKDLQKHKRIHGDKAQHPYQCTLCPNAYLQAETFADHMRTHTGERPFHCDQCGKDFGSRGGLRNHLKWMHSQNDYDKAFECTLCGKQLKNAACLQTHMYCHSEERPHACLQCDKRFVSKAYLVNHTTRVHSQEKPFSCSYCPKKFTVRPAMAIHELIHTGEKPFPCKYCGKPFRLSTHRSRHTKICKSAPTPSIIKTLAY